MLTTMQISSSICIEIFKKKRCAVEEQDVGARVESLANKIKALLETYALQNREIAGPYMDRAREMRREIESYGFLVDWEINPSTNLQAVTAHITLYKVKENLSSEDQKIYDNWLMKRSGIKNT